MRAQIDDRLTTAFPVLRNIEWAVPLEGDEFSFNTIGARIRERFMSRRFFQESSRIAVNEAMFEWVDILESVQKAGIHYVMVDLGAGFGRWLVNASIIARRLGRTCFVIGVEAEDNHFAWMQQHLADNEIPPAECRLLHAPITRQRKDVPFTMGHSHDWYGQAVLPSKDTGFGDWPQAKVEIRRSIILEDVVGDTSIIDLLDLDIQGMEAEVVSSSIGLINQHVKRLHIGTHSHDIENVLRSVMKSAGWYARFDYPCTTLDYPTPAGRVDFVDGVQSWINPIFS